MQTLTLACKCMPLHATACICKHFHTLAYKCMQVQAFLYTCMQIHAIACICTQFCAAACNCMQIHANAWICMHMHTIALAPCPKKFALGPAPCLSKFVFWQVPWLKKFDLGQASCPSKFIWWHAFLGKKYILLNLLHQTVYLWPGSLWLPIWLTSCKQFWNLLHRAYPTLKFDWGAFGSLSGNSYLLFAFSQYLLLLFLRCSCNSKGCFWQECRDCKCPHKGLGICLMVATDSVPMQHTLRQQCALLHILCRLFHSLASHGVYQLHNWNLVLWYDCTSLEKLGIIFNSKIMVKWITMCQETMLQHCCPILQHYCHAGNKIAGSRTAVGLLVGTSNKLQKIFEPKTPKTPYN